MPSSVREYAILYVGGGRVSRGSAGGGNVMLNAGQHALDGPEHTGQLPADRVSVDTTGFTHSTEDDAQAVLADLDAAIGSGDFVTKIEGGQSTINAIGTTGAAEDIDPTLGNVATATLGDDTVFTILEPVGSADSILAVWIETGAGGFTPTFDADGGSFAWDGTTPTLPTDPSVVYRVILERVPATTNDWVGVFVGGSGSSVVALDDLSDVTIATPLDKQRLRYDSGSGLWLNSSLVWEMHLSYDGTAVLDGAGNPVQTEVTY